MESNPFKVIPLLGDSSLCRGNIISGTGSILEDNSVRGRFFFKKPVCGFDGFWDITCIRIVDFNICLYKSVINY